MNSLYCLAHPKPFPKGREIFYGGVRIERIALLFIVNWDYRITGYRDNDIM